jgi:hypothetical protein
MKMFKVLRGLIALDKAITRTLTRFCWWTDIHFGKDNVWWTNVTVLFFYPTLQAVLIFVYQENTEELIGNFIAGCFIAWVVLYVLNKTPSSRSIFLNAKKSPNANKHLKIISSFKLGGIVAFVVEWYLANIYIYLAKESVVVLFLTLELSLYFLCTEPVPPAERDRRSKEDEMRKRKLVLTANK